MTVGAEAIRVALDGYDMGVVRIQAMQKEKKRALPDGHEPIEQFLGKRVQSRFEMPMVDRPERTRFHERLKRLKILF